jgi:hypothetical protein
MSFKGLWLPSVLRAAGCSVVEVKGWEERGRGDLSGIRGVLLHHTAGPLKGDAPSLPIVINGRPDLPGPLSQLFLARSGVWHVVAAGRANHAGKGIWTGLTLDGGNGYLLGVEAENTGLANDPWPAGQYESYVVGVTAILRKINAQAIMAVGHKEYAQPAGRKSDPSFDMVAFRAKVAAKLNGGAIS